MKYIKFYEFLEKNEEEVLTLTYEELENIIGRKLPKSAYKYDTYFSNSPSHTMSRIWLELGYGQTKLELGKYLVLEKLDR